MLNPHRGGKVGQTTDLTYNVAKRYPRHYNKYRKAFNKNETAVQKRGINRWKVLEEFV